MDSPELFFAFGAVMLVIALLGVAIDWFGKPMRHRKFVPKIYRFPDERQPRRSKVRETEWSDTAFVLPVAEPTLDELLVRYPDVAAPDAPQAEVAQLSPVPDHGPPTTQVPGLGLDDAAPIIVDTNPLADIVTLEDQLGEGAADALLYSADRQPTDEDQRDASAGDDETVDADEEPVAPADSDETANTGAEPAAPAGDGDVAVDAAVDPHANGASTARGEQAHVSRPPQRKTGWKPGEYVFNLTPSGDEPTAATVRSRYWKNVAATVGAGLFGETNISRMTAGKAPERRNPRTHKLESMRLPHTRYDDTGGETPIPQWPTSELDPFAG